MGVLPTPSGFLGVLEVPRGDSGSLGVARDPWVSLDWESLGTPLDIADSRKVFRRFSAFNSIFCAWNPSQTSCIRILYILAKNQPIWPDEWPERAKLLSWKKYVVNPMTGLFHRLTTAKRRKHRMNTASEIATA